MILFPQRKTTEGWRGSRSGSQRKLAPGFSLIEVVAAVAVAAILVAMILPVMQLMLHGGKSSGCVNNLRQIGMAFHLYLQDHNQRLPQRFYPGSNPTFGYDELLLPYLEDNYEVFICPDVAKTNGPRKPGTPTYGMNWYYDNTSIFSVEAPGRTILIAEAAGGRLGSHRADRDNLPPGQLALTRHHGKANYLFFDGRVQTLGYQETLQPFDAWGTDHGWHDQPPP